MCSSIPKCLTKPKKVVKKNKPIAYLAPAHIIQIEIETLNKEIAEFVVEIKIKIGLIGVIIIIGIGIGSRIVHRTIEIEYDEKIEKQNKFN